MECRLCLRLVTADCLIPIFENSNSQVERIWSCCNLRVQNQYRLPDMICLSCESNLSMFSDFKTICAKNDKTVKLRLNECLNIKVEEVLLDNLVWEDNWSHTNVLEFKKKCNPEDCENQSKNVGKGNINQMNVITDHHFNPNQISPNSSKFFENSTLKVHMEYHSGEKSFKCEICLKVFRREDDLKEHMKYHIEEKPFKCDICSKCFVLNGALKLHMKRHIGIKPFQCVFCSRSYLIKSELTIHMKYHMGETHFKCEICSKGFVRKCTLQIHMKFHTGEKPFKCDICSRGFVQKCTLQVHMKCHTGEKPFKCDICSKDFVKKSNLKRHQNIHDK
ncbi:uncharacterized protein LOC143918114 [Arctopsyche grandis]|uniref:uncharacterized protein LOC143918114 n=1 Tax=Arctopsyche grandis TaxID=121162 RepID=UPI00406DA23F